MQTYYGKLRGLARRNQSPQSMPRHCSLWRSCHHTPIITNKTSRSVGSNIGHFQPILHLHTARLVHITSTNCQVVKPITSPSFSTNNVKPPLLYGANASWSAHCKGCPNAVALSPLFLLIRKEPPTIIGRLSLTLSPHACEHYKKSKRKQSYLLQQD